MSRHVAHSSRGLALAVLLSTVASLGATSAMAAGGCVADATTLCLHEGRFQVEVSWQDYPDNPYRTPGAPDAGVGHAVPLSEAEQDAGAFWFADPDDLDLLVKVVDGSTINGRFWVFVLPTTDVAYSVEVTDTTNDERFVHDNAAGTRAVLVDTSALPGVSPSATAAVSPIVRRASGLPATALPSCADPAVTCLQGGRIAVTAEVKLASLPDPPPTKTILETETSALVAYLSQEPDLVVKVLRSPQGGDRFWAFFATLLAAEVTVTDLETSRATTFDLEDRAALADGDLFAPDPPSATWITTPEIPGFRFQTRVTAGDGEVATRTEADCIPETLCVSAAIPGRSELFLRIVGPKPNGYLWPNLVKFSTSRIEVWIEQIATGTVSYYRLDEAAPGGSDLTGYFDREGFQPVD